MGSGGEHNYEGGGGGGCGTGYKDLGFPAASFGCGMGGHGGGSSQDGLKGDDGICCIFMNFIPGVSPNCNVKKV